MIHCDVCEGKIQLMVNGRFDQILSESAYMIFTIYRQLLKNNAYVAETYRDFFEHNGDAIFTCGEELTKKPDGDVKKSVEGADEIDELLEALLKKIKSKKESEEN